jgi:lysophospholipase L1-like esterase
MKKLLGVFLLCSALFSQDYLFEIYGDSLSAGFYSDTNLANNKKSSYEITDDIKQFLTFKTSKDDVEKQKVLSKYERRDLMWAQKLKGLFPSTHNIRVENYAQSGGRAYHLPNQIAQKGIEKDSTVAFVFIGHNDLCGDYIKEAEIADYYQQNLNQAITTWDQRHKNSKLIVIPLAEVYNLYPALTKFLWLQEKTAKLYCEDSWRLLFPYCTENYKQFKANQLEKNMLPKLKNIATAANETIEAWRKKSTSNEYYYLKDFKMGKFLPKFFAVDCYHLSEDGQQAFANELFPKLPF